MKKTAMVTGAYGAIGKAIVTALARKDYTVYPAGRDENKLTALCHELTALTGNRDIYPVFLDLSLRDEIRQMTRQWDKPLDLLVNNAATGPKQRTETADGTEMQWAVNVLSYFRLTEWLHPLMKGRPDARIVNVASYWAGGLDIQDVEFRIRRYDNDAVYRQAKQANRMLTAAHAKLLINDGITVNACHPGDVNSKLSNSFGFGGHETPEQGAATPLMLATDPVLKGKTGHYYEHMQKVSCPFSSNAPEVAALYDLCKQY